MKLLAFIFLILVSCSVQDQTLTSQKKWMECFPENFFVEPPNQYVNKDSIVLDFVITHRAFHKIHYHALNCRAWQCFNNSNTGTVFQRAQKEGIHYRVYSSKRDTNLLAEFHVINKYSPSVTSNGLLIELYDLLLRTDPHELVAMDQIIKLYRKDYDSSIFDIELLDIYMAANGSRSLQSSDIALLDSILVRSKINSEYIDTTFVRQFNSYIRLIYENQPRELIIEDLIHDDSLQPKSR